MKQEKIGQQKIKYPHITNKDTPILGRDKIMKEENENPEKLLCPKAGTATSSPTEKTASQSNMNIVNVMLWMKRNAYEDSTIKKVAKLLRHLKRNCNTKCSEDVKLFVAKKCSNGHKDNTLRTTLKYISLFEDTSTWIPIACETDEEIKQAIQDDCILVCQANGKIYFKKPA